MRTARAAAACLVFCAAGAASAGSVDLGLNNESARAAVAWSLSPMVEVEPAWFHDSDDGDAAAFGMHAVGEATFAENLEGGIGAEAFWADDDTDDGYGLALGGYVRWGIASQGRLTIGGDLHFGPDIFTAGDLEGYWNAGARIGYRVLSSAEVWAGYRFIEVAPKLGDDSRIASDAHVGFRLLF